jgi:hypothetical protein
MHFIYIYICIYIYVCVCVCVCSNILVTERVREIAKSHY